MLARSRPGILRELYAPSPGRGARTLELVAKVTIVVVVSMTFQIPDPALSAYIVFFVSKEDSGRSILISIVFILAIAVVIVLLFLLAPTTLNHPSFRILVIAATSFTLFFLGKASKLEPLAGTLGLILATGLANEQKAPVGEIATRGLLYVALFAIFPILVNIAFNFVCGRHPERLLRDRLAGRLRSASDALLGKRDATARLQTLIALGNAEPATELKMAALFRRSPRHALAQMKTLIGLSYALLIAVAARGSHDAAEDPKLAARLDRLADRIGARTSTIGHDGTYGARGSDAGRGDVAALVGMLAATVADPVAGAKEPEPGSKAAAKQKGGFFKPDAFSNPAYERFAAKATAAVMVCYLTFNILDWPGISTCMVTCFIVALSTVGESTQKMSLRLTGCTFGAALGYATIVFVLPMTTQITGLVLVIGIVTLPAAYVAFGSSRVSYIGFQIAFAAYLCLLQGAEPKFDLTIARDRFIGILFGNVVVFFIFTQIYVTSLLPGLTRDLVTILERCRDALRAIAEAEPLHDITERIAGVQALVGKIEGEIVAYGFERRPRRYGRLHVLSVQLIANALHDIVSDVAGVSACRHVAGRDALRAGCAAADRRLEALAGAISSRKGILIEGSRTELPGASDFHRHLDGLTIAAARYRRILARDRESVHA